MNNWGRLKANNIKAIENRNFMQWGPLGCLIVSRFKSKPEILKGGANKFGAPVRVTGVCERQNGRPRGSDARDGIRSLKFLVPPIRGETANGWGT
jgi:hypothetical protein